MITKCITSVKAVEEYVKKNHLETVDIIEGNLVDHVIYYDPVEDGYFFCREAYINCWESGYYVTFARYASEKAGLMWKEWYELRDLIEGGENE